MKGIIGLEKLRINCIIGVNIPERTQEQEILVDVKVQSSFLASAASDQIKDTINYERLASICIELALSRRYKLLETFAYDVIQKLREEFDIEWAWIKVRKPKAIDSVDYTFVELEHKEKS